MNYSEYKLLNELRVPLTSSAEVTAGDILKTIVETKRTFFDDDFKGIDSAYEEFCEWQSMEGASDTGLPADRPMADLRFLEIGVDNFRAFPKSGRKYGMRFHGKEAGKPRSFICVGNNGVGKSSVFDALEWKCTGFVSEMEFRNSTTDSVARCDLKDFIRHYGPSQADVEIGNVCIKTAGGDSAFGSYTLSPFFCTEKDLVDMVREMPKGKDDDWSQYIFNFSGFSHISDLINDLEDLLAEMDEIEHSQPEKSVTEQVIDFLRSIDTEKIALLVAQEKDLEFFSEEYDFFAEEPKVIRPGVDSDKERRARLIAHLDKIISGYDGDSIDFAGKNWKSLKSAVKMLRDTCDRKRRKFANSVADSEFFGRIEAFLADNEFIGVKEKLVHEGENDIKFNISKRVNDSEALVPVAVYFNTFRTKLVALLMRVSLAMSIMERERVKFPLVFDDIFYSSDFDNKYKLSAFFSALFRQLGRGADLQLIFFTHDELMISICQESLRQCDGFEVDFARMFDISQMEQDWLEGAFEMNMNGTKVPCVNMAISLG